MARKGQKRGLKRSKTTKLWRIARKEKKWTINPHPGPHSKEAIPLAFIVRNYLGYAHTLREAKRILNERKVKINGAVRCDFKFPVGIMDVVDIPVTGKCYRVLPNKKGNLIIHPVTEVEKHFRLLKITRKHLVKGGKTQLRLHDGSTLLVDQKMSYATHGTLLYDFDSKKILEYFPFAEGTFAMITGGRNVSKAGNIASIQESMVEIDGEEKVRTLRDYVFVIGKKESSISLPGG